MAIKFVCTCGKHLRARDELARRRTFCPACGRLVGVPALEPTQRGTEARPLTPSERRWTIPQPNTATEPLVSALQATTPAEALTEAPPKRRPRRARNWWGPAQVFLPLTVGPLLLGLAAGLTLVSTAGILLLRHTDGEALPWGYLALWGFVALGVLAYVAGFLQCVFHSGLTRETACVRWPAADAPLVLQAGLTGLLSFLAGPAVLVAVAACFWLNAGDFLWLDWMIFLELVTAAASAWLLGFAAATLSDRLRDVLPGAVVALVWRLRWRAVAGALLGAFGILGYSALTVTVAEDLHLDLLQIPLLLACSLLFVCWMAVLMRWLGLCCSPEGPSAGS
jgi:hypothetical protein